MKPPRPRRLITENLAHHRATVAWNRVAETAGIPTVIHALKPDRPGKCAVFRLVGVRENGESVIAKRCSPSELQYELLIYRTVLPALPVRTPALLGHLEEEEAVSHQRWIFIEDLGDASYDHSVPAHRARALRWLGRMHSSSRDLPRQMIPQLRRAGTAVMRAQARVSSGELEVALDDGIFHTDELLMIERLRQNLAELEAHPLFSEEPDGEQGCFIHGDFVRKNIRLTDSTIAAFDWEHAGWGDHAIDLAAFRNDDLDPYLREFDAGADPDVIRRRAHLGMVHRLVQSVAWEIPGLRDQPPTRSVERLRLYASKIESELATLSLRQDH